jgi:hypothetical protein
MRFENRIAFLEVSENKIDRDKNGESVDWWMKINLQWSWMASQNDNETPRQEQ